MVRSFAERARSQFERDVPETGGFDLVEVGADDVSWVDPLTGELRITLWCTAVRDTGGATDGRELWLRRVRFGASRPLGTFDSTEALLSFLADERAIDALVTASRVGAGPEHLVETLTTEPPGLQPYEVTLDTTVLQASGRVDCRPPGLFGHQQPAADGDLVGWSFARGTEPRLTVERPASYNVVWGDHTHWCVRLGPDLALDVWKEDYDEATSWLGAITATEACALLLNPACTSTLLRQPREWEVKPYGRASYTRVEIIPDGGSGRGSW